MTPPRPADRDTHNAIVTAIATMPKPVIAAINGDAVGAGLSASLVHSLGVARATYLPGQLTGPGQASASVWSTRRAASPPDSSAMSSAAGTSSSVSRAVRAASPAPRVPSRRPPAE